MDLLKLKACANCGKGLFRAPHASAYLVRVSQIMPNPTAINQTMGLAAYFQGNFQLGSIMSPSKGKEIIVIADEMEGGKWDEFFICFPCASGMFEMRRTSLLELVEAHREKKKEDET